MKKFIPIALLSMALVGSAFAQAADPIAVQRAVTAVPVLRSMMKDPDSFQLESVYQTKGRNKNQRNDFFLGQFDVCFVYRAHNSYGAYSGSEVALQIWSAKKMEKNGRIIIFDRGEHLGTCAADNIAVDITAEVKAALAPPPAPAPPADSAEDKAKHAQQYADCLKLAVDNPKVVCKQ
ncbi:MAG: hypothetical protein ABR920_16185 [Terriglobales bacterium]